MPKRRKPRHLEQAVVDAQLRAEADPSPQNRRNLRTARQRLARRADAYITGTETA